MLERPKLPSSSSNNSSGSSQSSVTLSTPGTSGLSSPAPFSTGSTDDSTRMAADATPVLFAPTGVPLVPLPSSSPIHSFPAFILGLVHSVEADPESIASHLSNLRASHAAPATFSAIPEGKPAETDQIVDALLRIAAKLKQRDTPELIEASATPKLVEQRALVGGNDDVRKSCEEQIKALKLLHAEELHRAQVSHDEEVRSVPLLSLFPYRAYS